MKNYLILTIGLIGQMFLFGQVPPDPGDNALIGGNPDELPIDQYTLILIILLVGVGVWFYKNKKQKINKIK